MVPSKKNRREEIVEAANRLFGQYGIEKTTIDDIAKEADIGKGSIYLEFGSKEEIVMAIISQFMESEIQRLNRFLQSTKTKNYLELLKNCWIEYILSTYDLAYPRCHTPEAMIHTSFKVRKVMKHLLDEMDVLFVSILIKAVENREIDPKIDPKKTMNLIHLSLDALFPPYACKAYNDRNTESTTRKEVEEQASGILDLIINGLRKKR